MLTKLVLKNFKRFEEAEIELGSPVVFIGPNDSGKTTALQAVALWDLGLKRWIEKRGVSVPGKRPGVAINRRDFIAAPIPNANLLWRDLHTRDVQRINGKLNTANVRIEILAKGITNNKDSESLRMAVPPETESIKVAFLPPMSGLSELEFAKQRAEISWLIGQGRTAEVLRNLCHLVKTDPDSGGDTKWLRLAEQMEKLFGIRIQPPLLAPERAELTMSYLTKRGTKLDIWCLSS